MSPKKIPINLWNLVSPIAKTFDLMSPPLAEHGQRVAYLAMRLGEELDLPAWKRRELAIAGALHDIGAFSLKERLDLLDFETTDAGRHPRVGHLLLRRFPPFERIAQVVRYHHQFWQHGRGDTCDGEPVPEGSHLLHLADRIAVLIRKEAAVLGQVPEIRDSILSRKGEWFAPPFVEAFLRLAERDYVWLEITSGAMESALKRALGMETIETDVEGLLGFSRLVCRIIDFKSEFTATHSSGVAATGRALASRIGFSRQECTMFEIAAYLHDLGKLAIPSEILEKKGRLTDDEWSVMRTHVYFTYQILNPIEVLDVVSSWSSLHQERLNGSGYPFHYTAEELPLGARVMAVADVFTGITEDRPYRKGMGREQALGVLRGMAESRELDPGLVELLTRNFEEIDRARAEAQREAVREYREFREALG